VATISPVLVVTSDPPGARVVVDGIGRGTTPARIEYLSLGEKTVRVLHDGYVSEERSLSLTPKQPTVTLHVELRPN
jgi:serine/threonine-protein kinase